MSENFSKNVPQLPSTLKAPLHQLEQRLLDQQVKIESWFREKWQQVPTLFYSSVDLRNAGFKLAPIDTNLFPAGFNNLNPDFMPLYIQAVQATIETICPTAKQILLVPESHTGHMFYFEHLACLQEILAKAGFSVHIGSLLEELKAPKDIRLPSGKSIRLEPLQRVGNRLAIDDFSPCVVLLNNDLAGGVPAILQGLEQEICPPIDLGWATRSKANHFYHYEIVSREFAKHLDIDPWLISPFFRYCGEVNFMTGEGQQCLVSNVEALFESIQRKYAEYGIEHPPFVIIKADAGTYGMAVMTIKHVDDLKHLNRKQRTNMSTIKGGRAVSKVIIQEGVYTFETWGEEQSVAEPVVYMVGHHVVGGFYRVHAQKGVDENLNAPGMNFQPLPFIGACNNPCHPADDCANRFYAYGVIARLALLAAAMESQEQVG